MSFTVLLAAMLNLAPTQAFPGPDVPGVAPGPEAPALDSLITRALLFHPDLSAARDRVDAARFRVAPSGSLPDPRLSVGLSNFPVADPGFRDLMTMKVVGITQSLPFPGKRSLARSTREGEVEVAEAEAVVVRAGIVAEVKKLYYELAFLDGVLDVLERNRDVLLTLVGAAAVRFEVSDGRQEDVLSAQVDLAGLAAEAASVVERRRGMNSRLESLVGVAVAGERFPFPEWISALAAASIRGEFASTRLGARATDSPLPPVETLVERSSRSNPEAFVHRSLISVQRDRVAYAEMAHLPDFSISLSYAERSDRPDMVSLLVSVPLAFNRAAKQSSVAHAEVAELSALTATHAAHLDAVHARVAELHARAESERTRMVLFQTSILPQGRAAVEAALAGFTVGSTDFEVLLASERTVFEYEIALLESVSEFASSVAELERVVGEEVLR